MPAGYGGILISAFKPPRCPNCRSFVTRLKSRDAFPCPACNVNLRIRRSYNLATTMISVALSLALLVGLGLDFFWSMVAFLPVLLAVLFVVTFVAGIVAPPKLEVLDESTRP